MSNVVPIFGTFLQENGVLGLSVEKYIPTTVGAITSPDNAFKLLEEVLCLSSRSEEHTVVICLDNKKYPIGVFVVSVGGINYSVLYPREVFKKVLLCNAVSIIMAHNHPSGNTTPSKEDLEITKRLHDSGELLGFALDDHIVVGKGKYFSMREEQVSVWA